MFKQSEIKKLKRADLLELLIAQSKENEQLQARLEEAEKRLSDRTLAIEKAGSIAEAALQLNGVFRAAEAAVQQYTDNIRQRSAKQEEACQQMLADARREADQILTAAEAHKAQCQKEAEAYWSQVSERLERFYDEHKALREILQYEKP